MHHTTTAHIDLGAIRANFALATSLAPQAQIMAVVKANAYGHGMLRVAEALRNDTAGYAVATVDEAMKLRTAGFAHTILVMEGATSPDSYETAASLNVTLMLHSAGQVAAAVESKAPVWIKVDTGMHRLGVEPDEIGQVLGALRAGGVDVQALCTHLACADELDNDASQKQLDAFASVSADIDLPRSIANSAGILGWPASHADWNRPGIMLYGSTPFSTEVENAAGLQPAMTLTTEIIAIRDVAAGESVGYGERWIAERPSVIATAAIGYADGYPRHIPNGTPTFVNGAVAPLAGVVSMDMITLDLTDHPGAAVGDAVELWGPNISVNDVADRAGSISYELLTGVPTRVRRTYT
jgi:alanine racemase